MAKKLLKVSKKTMEKLEQFDYKHLYSIHDGANPEFYWDYEDRIEIFVGVNRYASLYIIAQIDCDHSKTFNFDDLQLAVDWIMRRIEVEDETD